MDPKLKQFVKEAGLPQWATDDNNRVNIADRLVRLDELIRADERRIMKAIFDSIQKEEGR